MTHTGLPCSSDRATANGHHLESAREQVDVVRGAITFGPCEIFTVCCMASKVVIVRLWVSMVVVVRLRVVSFSLQIFSEYCLPALGGEGHR